MFHGNFRSLIAVGLIVGSNAAFSQVVDICPNEASRNSIHTALRAALIQATAAENGGFGLEMWGSVVNRDGIVCAVAFSGDDRGDQWPGSRVISAQKANTANAFSLPGLALSTANLWEPPARRQLSACRNATSVRLSRLGGPSVITYKTGSMLGKKRVA